MVPPEIPGINSAIPISDPRTKFNKVSMTLMGFLAFPGRLLTRIVSQIRA
jgi:hypothetical protein